MKGRKPDALVVFQEPPYQIRQHKNGEYALYKTLHGELVYMSRRNTRKKIERLMESDRDVDGSIRFFHQRLVPTNPEELSYDDPA